VNFTAFYTFSKTLAGNAVNEYICTCLEKAPASFNNKHTLSATGTYELPVGKGRAFLNHGGWRNTLLGGYNLTIAFSARSGGPLNVGLTGAPTLTYPAFVANYGNVELFKDPELRNDWQNLGGDRFNTGNQNNLLNCTPNATGAALTSSPGTQCFSYIPSYGMGNDGSYITNSQRIIAFAFSATKEIQIKERLRFQFRYDFQNPFKWYTWNAPNNVLALGSPTLYGKITGNLDAGTANLGGQPLMNLGFALIW
jgi:hypothetical protein